MHLRRNVCAYAGRQGKRENALNIVFSSRCVCVCVFQVEKSTNSQIAAAIAEKDTMNNLESVGI